MKLLNKVKRRSDVIILIMVFASIILYWADFVITGDFRSVFLGLIGNLAFLPIYVLFVTLMIERLLKQREKELLQQKMNMVIGVFFSEVGTPLLKSGFCFLVNKEELASKVRIAATWQDQDFHRLSQYLGTGDLKIDSRLCCLDEMKDFLVARRNFMLSLLENPNLLEHDGFTDLLWAVFHLLEELQMRPVLQGLSEADMDHLSGDIRRAYTHLLKEWIVYLLHLKSDYPYLFSLAVRNNPLNPEARVELQ